MAQELSADQLRWSCELGDCVFDDTSALEGLPEMIGQDRALRALDFGVGIDSHGFNVYALGQSGTGRMTAITSILERSAAGMPAPDDWCYVYNFSDPKRPNAVRLSSGKGSELKADMADLINDLKSEIRNAFDDEKYEQQKSSIVNELRQQESDQFTLLSEDARKQGLGLQRTPQGMVVVPLHEGKPMTPEEYGALPEEARQEIDKRRQQTEERFNEIARAMVRAGKDIRQRLQDLDAKITGNVVKPHVADLREKYETFPDVVRYLDAVEENIVGHAEDFRLDEDEKQPADPFPRPQRETDPFKRYEVNVLIDNSGLNHAPVVLEPNATFFNLIGRIEHQASFGTLTTDFTMIKAGALHRANGGYLVIEARDALSSSFTYDALKKALENAEIRIEEPGEQFRTIATVSIEPAPIPLDIKVVMVGSAHIYHLLMAHDEDFRTLFKVKADFAVDMKRTPQSMGQYASFIAQRCREEGLLHFDQTGVVKVVEYGVRLSEDQNRLTTRFMDIADLIREASYWANRNGHDLVTGEDVQTAIKEKIYRSNMIDERLRDLITEGTVMVDVAGEVVGQINGLAVLNLGDYMFGKPSRITARTFTGQAGIVNIERESKMSGRTHDKGVLILSGYLGGQYAHEAPLSLSASITFEQSYQGVDGDSASSTELYAILSSLAQAPIRQQYAVTGSVNQPGEIQPIGGVNHKIEGYYDVCKAKGLTGDQGVLIPHQNVKNLMLREDIVEAVREGKFHIYPVTTIDEGIEILTGIPAGARGADGDFPEDTIHGRVERRLKEIREHLKKAKGKDESEEEQDEEG